MEMRYHNSAIGALEFAYRMVRLHEWLPYMQRKRMDIIQSGTFNAKEVLNEASKEIVRIVFHNDWT